MAKTKSEKFVTSNITIEGAKLIKRNFRGQASDWNEEGNRNFGVLIPADMAESLKEDGWNIKFLPPRNDDDEEQAWLPVKVKFGKINPTIVMITKRGKLRLDEDTVSQLDWSIIENADIIIRPYNYPAIRGRAAGVSAYLKALYITIAEDNLALKYRDIPDLDDEPTTDDEAPFK